jgi:mRNA degradation ribonuclease J1/J2
VGFASEELGPDALRQRKELARGGHLTIAIGCDAGARISSAPVLRAHGVPLLELGSRAAGELETLIEKEWSSVRRRSTDALEAQIARLARGFLETRHRLSPVISVVVTGLDEARPAKR